MWQDTLGHDYLYRRAGVAQTLLSVLWQIAPPDIGNRSRELHHFFFFGFVAAMYSVTFARNSFAADSSSGSVIVGRSASIIASASLNLPSLALFTASWNSDT